MVSCRLLFLGVFCPYMQHRRWTSNMGGIYIYHVTKEDKLDITWSVTSNGPKNTGLPFPEDMTRRNSLEVI